MKTLKGIVIDKINKDNSGNAFFELIAKHPDRINA